MPYFQPPTIARCQRRRLNQGFTLIEILVVVFIIGVLAAIAPSFWFKYVANRHVTTARNEIYRGLKQAQHEAITHRGSWRFSIREMDDQLAWAIHPDSVGWQTVTSWKTLHPAVVFDDHDTTLLRKAGTYYTRFGIKGEVTVRLGTITLDSQNGIAKNKCVVVSTLIGATRKGEEHLYPNGKRYCY